jgi:peptide/nickel transport system substrate-binding protein
VLAPYRSRRLFRLAPVALAAILLPAACAPPAAPPAPTSAPAAKQAAPAAATAAPADAAKPTEAAKPAEAAKPVEAAKPAPQPAGKTGGNVVIAMNQEAQTLLWTGHATPYGGSMVAVSVMCEPMLRVTKERQLAPGALAEVPATTDGRSYTLKIRPGLTWDDGQPVTMRDFVFTWKWITDPANKASVQLGWDKIEGVQLSDNDMTGQVQLKEVFAPFNATVLAGTYLLPEHALSAKGAEAFARDPVCNGPFKFKEWVAGDHITFDRNPNYYAGPAKLDQVTFKIIPDRNTMLAQARAGSIDIGYGYSELQAPELEKMNHLKVVTEKVAQFERMPINTRDPEDVTKPHPILSDINVRKALILATDRQTIVDQVLLGRTTVAINDLRTTPWFNEKLQPYPYNPEESKRILDAAGWAPGPDGIRVKNGVPLRLKISTTAGSQQRDTVQVLLQQNLKDVGIDLVIENHPGPRFFAAAESGGILYGRRFDLAIHANGLQGVDPDLYYHWHSSQIGTPQRMSGANFAGWSSPELDRALEERIRTTDPAKQKELLLQAQELIYEGYALLPLYDSILIFSVANGIQGLEPNGALAYAGMFWNVAEWTKQ